jgi:hypothetical protein
MVFRIRELLIRQRTQAINALRGHLGEFGQIVPQGATNATRLVGIVEDPDSSRITGSPWPTHSPTLRLEPPLTGARYGASRFLNGRRRSRCRTFRRAAEFGCRFTCPGTLQKQRLRPIMGSCGQQWRRGLEQLPRWRCVR